MLIGFLLAALAQAPARDVPAPAAVGTAIIRGRVLAAGAHERPLSRVEVRAVCASLKVNKAALTDGNGRYEFGEPVVGAQVMPMRYAVVNGERRMQPSGQSGTSDDLGEYRIYGLAPGQYFIAAAFRTFGSGEASDRAAYAPTYYPGTANTAEAQKMTVAAGQTIGGVNMTLLPAVA